MFVSARAPAPKTVIYTDENGEETVREGGSRSWRNFNLGNIEGGSFANENGAIGSDTRFAIFPDEETGREAVVTLLRGPSYRTLTLAGGINRYAPPNENNTAGYVAQVVAETGLGPTDVLGDLPLSDVRAIAKAIKKIEGWIAGKETANMPFVLQPGEITAPVSSAAVAQGDWMAVAATRRRSPNTTGANGPAPKRTRVS